METSARAARTQNQNLNEMSRRPSNTAAAVSANSLAVTLWSARKRRATKIEVYLEHGKQSGTPTPKAPEEAAAPATSGNNNDATPAVLESQPTQPLGRTHGPTGHTDRKHAKPANAASGMGNPKSKRRSRGPRAPQRPRNSKEPTWTQVPVNAGYASPMPAVGYAQSMHDTIPTARSVSDVELNQHRQDGERKLSGKKRR